MYPTIELSKGDLTKKASRLYIGSPLIGGEISHDLVVNDYTEIEKDDNLYRSLPCFHKKEC